MNVSLLSSGLLGLAIFLSGFAALCYQLVWQRALTQSIGSDAITVALTITILWIGWVLALRSRDACCSARAATLPSPILRCSWSSPCAASSQCRCCAQPTALSR